MIRDTSVSSYKEERKKNKGQEYKLFLLFETREGSGEGLSDRQIAKVMDWTPAHASARRNGLAKDLDKRQHKYELVAIYKDKCSFTHKIVNFWGLQRRKSKPCVQGELFK